MSFDKEDDVPPPFPDVKWQMIEHVPGDPALACVFKEDLIKLRAMKKRADRCER